LTQFEDIDPEGVRSDLFSSEFSSGTQRVTTARVEQKNASRLLFYEILILLYLLFQ